jgi:hypothetical protein
MLSLKICVCVQNYSIDLCGLPESATTLDVHAFGMMCLWAAIDIYGIDMILDFKAELTLAEF